MDMQKTLLRVDASSRFTGSHSREAADAYEKKWLQENPEGKVLTRDLAKNPIGHIKDSTINGFYTPADKLTPEFKEAIALSDELISEVIAADEILLSTPMYNFSIPSALKAYIDQILSANNALAVDASGAHGLVPDKKVHVVY